MIRPLLFSEVAARYGLRLVNCDRELGQKKYCDKVLVLDTHPEPWREFFVRATILTVQSDWQQFCLDFRKAFDVVVYGYDRIPSYMLSSLLKEQGIIVDVSKDSIWSKE